MPFNTISMATKGSMYMSGWTGSGGAARSLIRTKVNSATSLFVSPARRISFMALNWFISRGPKILFGTSASVERKTSMRACAGTTLKVRVAEPSVLKGTLFVTLRPRCACPSGLGHCHFGLPRVQASSAALNMESEFKDWLGRLGCLCEVSSASKYRPTKSAR